MVHKIPPLALKLQMALKLLEEPAKEGRKDYDILKTLLKEICQRLIVVESLIVCFLGSKN